jgi:hypothetical protein
MNTWSESGGLIKPGSRGFYIEGREDHLVPSFFENFALFSEFTWLEQLIAKMEIPYVTPIRAARWSYSYEEVPLNERRPRIADILLMWRDASDEDAILAIEAKKPGCATKTIGPKDDPREGYYLKYGEMYSIHRRYQALLVDARDRERLSLDLQRHPCVINWQELAELQKEAAANLPIATSVIEILLTRLRAHYSALGLSSDKLDIPAIANEDRYLELAAKTEIESVQNWLIGSELFFATRTGRKSIDAPYDWLLDEPTAADYRSQKLQCTRDRGLPIWKITDRV